MNEVSDRLPSKMRDDLSKEIRSLIEDTLEDRARETGKKVDDEALVKEVLQSFGSPEKMAASYMPPRYLIGPRLFPIFWLVLRIVLGITALVWVVTLGVGIAESAATLQGVIDSVVRSIVEFFGSALAILGNVVFIFAIIEWLLPKVTGKEGKAWDPASLDDRRESDKVTLAESIAGLVFTLIVLLLFNVYPQFVGIGFMSDGKMVFTPALTEAFFKFLPALNIVWLLEIVKHALLIRENKWTTFTRWMDIVLSTGVIVIMLAMAFGAPILSLPAGSELAADPDLQMLFDKGVRALLIFVSVISGADIVKTLVRMFKK
jgi:hypothetical protein